MNASEMSFISPDGTVNFAYCWTGEAPKAVVQITHGAVEHALRYAGFAQFLAENGFAVYANDLRGHGKTAGVPENVACFSDKPGGFMQTMEDVHQLTQIIKERHPGLPVFLFGHSMGSLLARVYAPRYGKELSGIVLTGTGHVSPALVAAGRLLAKLNALVFGRKHRSPFLHTLIFGALNKPFGGGAGCEFICTVDAVKEVYAADPFCGNTVTAEFADELLRGTRAASKKQVFSDYPKDLPLFIGSGEFDSMGGAGLKEAKKDVADYRKAGVSDMEFHIYEGMRHEILNEKQNKRVYADIADWLEIRI